MDMNYKYLISGLLAVGGTAFTFLIGDFTAPLRALALFMAIDYITGVTSAFIKREASSVKCRHGILRKAGMLVIVIIANQVDLLLPDQYPVIKTLVCYFYLGAEGISITENLYALGVPIPKRLVKAFEELKKQGGID